MADTQTQETIADIVAEMRHWGLGRWASPTDIKCLADRIEATLEAEGGREVTMLIMANRFPSYEQARDVYLGLVEKYGATRLEWGFGRWLWLDYNAAEWDELEYWRALNKIEILTADGRKRLAKSEKQTAKEGGAK